MEALFIIKKFGNLFLSKFRLYRFQYLFRNNNAHNKVIAFNIFPISKVKVGNYTYGPITVHSWGSENEYLRIGHFCSIASNVKFILGGNHKMEYLSSYPFKHFYHGGEVEAYSNGAIVINDDVWIGSDVTILSGIEIGQGCVIAAGSVVTKSVPPYSIIGGVPAKIITQRFQKDVVDLLCRIDLEKMKDSTFVNHLQVLYLDLSNISKEDLEIYLQNLELLS